MAPLASDDAVEQVKARLNLVEVVQQHVPLRRRGRDWWGLCPFHQEKTPSFKVNEQQQSWYCFGCQSGGDVFSFVEQVEKVDFRGALQMLAEMAGVELKQQSPADRRRVDLKRRILDLNELAAKYYGHVLEKTEAGEPGRRLLADRQVDEETARRFGLGYAPAGANFATYLRRRGHSLADAQAAGLLRRDGSDYFQNRLMVPVRDERGRTVAFAGRTVLADEVRKYVNTPETPAYVKGRVVFALDIARPAIEEQKNAIIMEGQFDVIVAHQFGIRNAVASSGTALTAEQVSLLKRFTDELVLVFDNDQAGRAAAFKATKLIEAQQVRARIARIRGEAKDPDEFLRAGGDWNALLQAKLPAREQIIRDELEGLRGELGGFNPSLPDHLEVARQRLQVHFDDISDPVLWEQYDQLVKGLLNLNPRVPVFKHPDGRRAAQPERDTGLSSTAVGNNLSKRVDYLLQVLAVCPEALERVRPILEPDDLAEDDRAAYLRMVEALERGGADGLERDLDGFPPAEQQLVRRAWAAPPPGANAAVAEDVARQIRLAALTRLRRAIINGLREAERRVDAERVAELEEELRHLSARSTDWRR